MQRLATDGVRIVAAGWTLIAVSHDGVQWDSAPLPEGLQPRRVDWAEDRFLAIGGDSSIWTSSDGLSWSREWSGGGGLSAAAGGGARKVAVGLEGRIIVSVDGGPWGNADSGTSDHLNDVTWTGERFTAAEDSLPSAAVHSSRDGVTWWPEQLPQQYAVRDARVLSMAAWAGTLVAVGDRNTLLVASCGGGESYVPGVARNPGFQGTVWRSDLAVFNPGATRQEFALQLLERGRANPDPEPSFFALDAGLAVRYPDLVRTVFDRTTSGTVRISTTPGSAPLAVAGRTYNEAAGGSFGQGLGVLDSRAAVPAGRVAILPQLAHSSSMEVGFRTNIGLVNVSAGEIVVEIEVITGNGQRLGRLEETLLPYEHRQLDNVLARLTGSDVDVAYAAVHTRTPEARFLAYASVVDNRTGDPTLILPL